MYTRKIFKYNYYTQYWNINVHTLFVFYNAFHKNNRHLQKLEGISSNFALVAIYLFEQYTNDRA